MGRLYETVDHPSKRQRARDGADVFAFEPRLQSGLACTTLVMAASP